MSSKRTKKKQQKKDEKVAKQENSVAPRDPSPSFFARIKNLANTRTELFFGLGGWFFAVVSFGVTIFVYCIHLALYHYEVGYYHDYFGVPLMYIPEPLSNGITYFAIEAMIFFVFTILLFISTEGIDAYGMVQGSVILCGIATVLGVRYRFFFPLGADLPWSAITMLYYALYFYTFSLPLGVFVLFSIYLFNKKGGAEKSSPKMNRRRAKKNAIWLVLCYLFYITMYVSIPSKVGYDHASSTQSLIIAVSSEEAKTQLSDFGLEDISFWAILYQNDEGAVVSPCVLTENEVTIYSDYYCFIETDSLVHYVKTYDNIAVLRNDDGEELDITP